MLLIVGVGGEGEDALATVGKMTALL